MYSVKFTVFSVQCKGYSLCKTLASCVHKMSVTIRLHLQGFKDRYVLPTSFQSFQGISPTWVFLETCGTELINIIGASSKSSDS